MKLVLLRHAHADWPDWNHADAKRPLTAKGRKQARRVGAFLADRGLAPAVILSSPLPRARATAEIVAKKLKRKAILTPALAPGFSDRRLRVLLQPHRNRDVMLVGHEPDFSRLIRTLTGGKVKLPKAAVACLEFRAAPASGTLRWLLPPKLCRS